MKRFIISVLLLLMSLILQAAPRRALVEFTTSTSCQYCPCMDNILSSQVMQNYSQTVILAYHGTISIPDPYSMFPGHDIIDSLNGLEAGFSAPVSYIDRSFLDRQDYVSFYDSLTYRYANAQYSPIELIIISKNYDAASHLFTLTMTAKAEQQLTGEYYVNFVFTENNLISNQLGNGSCQGGSNYVHDWVTRSFANSTSGELLKSGIWNQNEIVSKTFSFPVSTAWNPANCEFNIFVYKKGSELKHSIVQQAIKGSLLGGNGIINNNIIATDFYLSQNYPNPFNPQTNIKFSIPEKSGVKLLLYNNIGQMVMLLFDGVLKSGSYNFEYDYSSLPSGVYYYRLITDKFSGTKKMVLTK